MVDELIQNEHATIPQCCIISLLTQFHAIDPSPVNKEDGSLSSYEN